MMQGECLCSGAASTCQECGVKVELKVHRSGAGYYIGTYCGCGPYSRESGYYRTFEEAVDALVEGGWYDRAGHLRLGAAEEAVERATLHAPFSCGTCEKPEGECDCPDGYCPF